MKLQKDEIRRIAKTRRQSVLDIHPNHGAQFADNMNLQFEKGTIIAGFYPRHDEINILPLLEKLETNGAKLCLPRINGTNEIDFHEYQINEELIAAPFGLFEPNAAKPILEPEILLVPLLAFDRNGNRLGYGKGHYDKAISKLHSKKQINLIGIAFSEQEFDALPAESHDQKLDFILTQNGLLDCAKS